MAEAPTVEALSDDGEDEAPSAATTLANVQHSRIAPSFLHSNAQAHRDVLFAWADLFDNPREAGARALQIDVRGKDVIVVSDDGCGMSERCMRDGILSLAYTNKDLTTGQHYGMGSTTALPRLSNHSLCFSLNGGHRTVGLLSSTLSKELGATELKIPQCTWSVAGTVFGHQTTEAPLTRAQRAASLAIITQHSPYTSEADLLAEFESSRFRFDPMYPARPHLGNHTLPHSPNRIAERIYTPSHNPTRGRHGLRKWQQRHSHRDVPSQAARVRPQLACGRYPRTDRADLLVAA